MPEVVTANHLRTGAVVYLTADGRWISTLTGAAIADTPEQLAALEAVARSAVEARVITAVYAFDVKVVDGRPTPVSVREVIRAAQAA